MTNNNLEAIMFEEFDERGYISESEIERWILMASGIRTDEKLDEYTKKLDDLQEKFEKYYEKNKNNQNLEEIIPEEIESSSGGAEIYIKATLLNEFLFEGKMNRYDIFFHSLTEIIDNQLSKKPLVQVGNCFGLSYLYAMLGLREKLNLVYIHSANEEESFGHASIGVKIEGKVYHMECTKKEGFKYTLPIHFEQKEKKSITEMIEFIYCQTAPINDKDKLISRYNNVLKLNPSNFTAMCGLGIIYTEKNMVKKALPLLKKAIELKPSDIRPYQARGQLHYNQDKFQDAISDLSEVIKRKPENIFSYNLRGKAYNKLNKSEEAISDFSEIIRISKNAIDDAIWFIQRKGLHPNEFFSMTEVDREILSDALFNRGNLYKKTGEYTKTLEDFERAIQNNSDKYKQELTPQIKELQQQIQLQNPNV